MVDIAIAGHLGGDVPGASLIGGIAIGTMLFDLLYWNFAFLRIGTGGLTAQACGRKDGSEGGILLRALRLAVISGLALIAVQYLVVQGAFLFVKCSPEVRSLAAEYFYIRIWAAPATLSLFALKGWFIGMQDTVRPMIADLLVNGLNMAVSALLSFGIPGLFEGLGFKGVAIGTVVAQWSGLLYCLLALRHRYSRCFHKGMVPAAGPGFFSMNLDLFLRALGMIAVYIGFTVISARYGDTLLAVSTILMKLLMFFSYFTDGFAYAGEALTGRYLGAGSRDGVLSAIRSSFAWSWAVAALFLLGYGLGGRWLFSLMTSDPSVLQAGEAFIPWLLLMPLAGCPAFVWDGIFAGATASADLRNSTLLCALGFFGLWFAGLHFLPEGQPEKAIHLLMAAYFLHLLIRGLYLTIRFFPIFVNEKLTI